MKQSMIIISIIIALLIIAGMVTFSVLRQQGTELRNDAQSDLLGSEDEQAVYTDLLGNPVSLENYAGKVLIINSWASWSPFSQTELTSLQTLASEFRDAPAVFLGINRQEPREQATRFVETLPNISLVTIVIDTTDHFYKAIEGYAMPETIIYNADGTTSRHIRGTFNESELRSIIQTSVDSI